MTNDARVIIDSENDFEVEIGTFDSLSGNPYLFVFEDSEAWARATAVDYADETTP